MRGFAILGVVAIALTTAACSRTKGANVVAFDGVFYKGKVQAERSNRKDFTATVRPVSVQALTGARAAGRHEGIKHCIFYYGTSDIAWVVGPDTPPEQLQLVGDTLTFRGSCME
ncbi:hypothetical protein [Puniceibacterium confluentis]|uniref:hypothetical protein n=1 Tax=Puniceibacterium confluentis TaxID=1958944 RepID=UPI001FE45AE0|nr:hypothetical protein [Puniceibacterium confluentis]